jgi:hypothetical protein
VVAGRTLSSERLRKWDSKRCSTRAMDQFATTRPANEMTRRSDVVVCVGGREQVSARRCCVKLIGDCATTVVGYWRLDGLRPRA